MKDLGLYVHIPFCKSKCNYCDFNSYANKEDIMDEYINSLETEFSLRYEEMKKFNIKSIFIGGGTPTYLNLGLLERLLKILKPYSTSNIEYSCEANPGTLSKEKLSLMKEYGINRLSIGLQSNDDVILRYLGRIHNLDDFIENYNNARKAGFQNINVDIMFSIKGQTIESYGNTLEFIAGINPEHISAYGLIIEEGTVFGEKLKSGILEEFDEDLDREMYYSTVSYLKNSGYNRYEISNFAKPGFECSHNIIYWKTNDYLGVGAGAHSYLEGTRFSNEPFPEDYINRLNDRKLPVNWSEILTENQKISEFMFMGLRMQEGVSIKDFYNRFGKNLLDFYKEEVQKMTENNLIRVQSGRLFLTDRGIDISNKVFLEFMV